MRDEKCTNLSWIKQDELSFIRSIPTLVAPNLVVLTLTGYISAIPKRKKWFGRFYSPTAYKIEAEKVLSAYKTQRILESSNLSQ
jgi:hypothetical protein